MEILFGCVRGKRVAGWAAMVIGFIGSGKMATALVLGVVETGVIPRDQVAVTDAVPAAAAALADAAGVRAVSSNAEATAAAEVLVLCVKPGDAAAALSALGPALEGKLVVSIVAGMTLAGLRQAAQGHGRMVRVMPNTPALVRRGAAAFALGEGATEADGGLVRKIFGAVGTIEAVPEKLLDAVTGLSGSGPAYGYLVIEALADGGVLMGLPRPLALELAVQTMLGAAEMVRQTQEHPALLREAVTSPGGTTAAGLEALEQGGLRAALLQAVRAATERARELGKPA